MTGSFNRRDHGPDDLYFQNPKVKRLWRCVRCIFFPMRGERRGNVPALCQGLGSPQLNITFGIAYMIGNAGIAQHWHRGRTIPLMSLPTNGDRTSAKAGRRGLSRYFPILQWAKTYDREALTSDTVAAVIVTIMLIPQSLAYALLAGLPAEMGLYASILPLPICGHRWWVRS